MSIREEDKSLSALAVYDELMRNAVILTEGSEAEFRTYVENSEVSRQRWEHAELECQRLSIELTKCSQDITTLENKLKQARLMFDNELHLRKKAEAERDNMANQLHLFKQLVMETDNNGMDEVTIDKIRGLDVCGIRPSYTNILSHGLAKEALNARVSAVNLTEASVLDVDDLSFDIDDTAGLRGSGSRIRAGTNFRSERDEVITRRKRSRSTTKTELPVVEENASKRGRRSRSIGNIGHVDAMKVETPRQKPRLRGSAMSEGRGRNGNISENMKRSTMCNYSTEGKENAKVFEEEIVTDHILVEKTVIKSEQCVVCSKRVKFGKISLKCQHCKETLHMECKDSAGACHATSPKVSNIPFPSLPTPNKRVSTYLTPSKKEIKRTNFASPMLR